MQGAWGGRGPESRSQDKGRGVLRLGTGGTEGLGTSPSLSAPIPPSLPSVHGVAGRMRTPAWGSTGWGALLRRTHPARQQPALDVHSSGIRLPQGV